MRCDTYTHELTYDLCVPKIVYLVSYSICQFLCSLQRFKGLENTQRRGGVRPG